VYAVGHVAVTARGRQLAAVLACGPGALLSHRSAAELWGVGPSSPRPEVTAPRYRRQRAGIAVHRSRSIGPADVAVEDAIPVTSVARTLVDLAEVLSERRLADAVHEAEVRRLFDGATVEAILERLPGRPGHARLRRVLGAYGAGPAPTRSEAERRFLDLCARAGLPAPQANVPIGGLEVDFLWRAIGVAVEVDGVAAHHTRRAFHADRRRDRLLAARGIQVVRVTWSDLVDEAALGRELAAVLDARSKAGSSRSGAAGR
jgi:Protein of unknown function (DUF559)